MMLPQRQQLPHGLQPESSMAEMTLQLSFLQLFMSLLQFFPSFANQHIVCIAEY